MGTGVGRWAGEQARSPSGGALVLSARLEGSLGVWALEDELGMRVGRADLGRGKRSLTQVWRAPSCRLEPRVIF